MKNALPVLLLLLLGACRSTDVLESQGRTWTLLDSESGAEVGLEEAADRLAVHDVVFLGEKHDSDTGHALQLRLTELLLDRRGSLALSLEMFERDVQDSVDDYLVGTLDEAEFLASSRPWKNYDEHYRPAVELARRRGMPVVAANAPKELVRAVSKEGLGALEGEEHVPDEVDAGPGAYRDRFAETMLGMHPEMEDDQLDDWFASQCLRDDTMAWSIVEQLERARLAAPIVVHWCGSFHSDYRQGTVERLERRRPYLSIGVVTMRTTDELHAPMEADERAVADYVMRIRE